MLKLIKHSSQISTIKITTSAVMLALLVLFGFVSHTLDLVIFPTVSFLKVEFVIFLCPFLVEAVGIVWSSVLVVIANVVRLSYSFDPVGMLALVIVYLVYIWSYFIIKFYLLKWKSNRTTDLNNPSGQNYLVNLIAISSAMVITTLVITACNYAFIYRLYLVYFGLPNSSFAFYVTVIGFVVAFNFINIGLNNVVFMSLNPLLRVLPVSKW